MENKIKVASFFCGCGGSDLGILGDFKFLKEKGFDGFLMGEYLMKNDNPGNKFGEFISNVSI